MELLLVHLLLQLPDPFIIKAEILRSLKNLRINLIKLVVIIIIIVHAAHLVVSSTWRAVSLIKELFFIIIFHLVHLKSFLELVQIFHVLLVWVYHLIKPIVRMVLVFIFKIVILLLFWIIIHLIIVIIQVIVHHHRVLILKVVWIVIDVLQLLMELVQALINIVLHWHHHAWSHVRHVVGLPIETPTLAILVIILVVVVLFIFKLLAVVTKPIVVFSTSKCVNFNVVMVDDFTILIRILLVFFHLVIKPFRLPTGASSSAPLHILEIILNIIIEFNI